MVSLFPSASAQAVLQRGHRRIPATDWDVRVFNHASKDYGKAYFAAREI
jgi:hypothetical protein